MTNLLKKRLISLLIVLLLSLNLFFVFNVSADWEKYDDDGIWYDEFDEDNTNNIILDDCAYINSSSGYIILDEGIQNPTYKYEDEYKDNIKVYEQENYILENLLGKSISHYISPDLNPGTEITAQDRLNKISAEGDNSELTTFSKSILTDNELNPNPLNPIQHFQFEINQKPTYIESLTFKWVFGDYKNLAYLDSIDIYYWTSGLLLPRWKLIESIEYTQSKIDNTPFSWIFDIDDFNNDDGFLHFLVIGNPNNDIPAPGEDFPFIQTDYISIEVETTVGYKSKGTVTSTLINSNDLDNFAGWNSIFWTSTKYRDDYGIKIEILDETDTIIKDIYGTTSPLDISSISKDKIKIRANFTSSSPELTPRLYNWGMTWSKIGEYADTFSNTFRVKESKGVEIDNGFVNISTYYSDWELFGKNNENTRSYDGKILSEPDYYYWYTHFSDKVGGGFRSPLVSDGIVYVASANNRVYAYEMKDKDDSVKFQDPIDNTSDLGMKIDSCLAISGDTLIVGTAKQGAKNKLYAFNKNDLSEKKWEYPPGDGSIMCFTSPPVIHKGVVYQSTWGGNFWDTSYFSSLSQIISLLLGNNNKLLALYLDDGSEIWSKTLPSASFSSPAVGNDMVYVACQKMGGKSLFAYDLDLGDEIWNQSVGIIGRSSPVIGDDILYILSNDKQTIKDSGENKIFAVDALNGEILWNKTMGPPQTTSFIKIVYVNSFFSSLIEGFTPVTTPAYYDDTLFIVTPNGTLLSLDADGNMKWNYSLSSSELLGMLDFYYSSPVVVKDYVYVVNGDGKLYAFNAENDNIDVEPIWTYQFETPGNWTFGSSKLNVLSSPVIADGLMFVTSTEDTINISGRLYCLGEYEQNKLGSITSNPVHVPQGYWWKYFNAENNSNNSLIFSILDNDGTFIKKVNSSNANITDLTSNSIMLHADFEIIDKEEPGPSLESWHLSWVEEKTKPEFVKDSFEPGTEGWVNQDLLECSILVKDNKDSSTKAISGIDTENIYYKIAYKQNKNSNPKYSDWIQASSDQKSGDNEVRIKADLTVYDSYYKVFNITFKAKDLAGNENTSKTTEFKTDINRPSSYIIDSSEYEDTYTDDIVIQANATDSEAGNVSGIYYVSLLYKYRNSTDEEWPNEWKNYDDRTEGIYTWSFGSDNIDSGYYQLITQAVDKASNIEDISDKAAVTFLFDKTNPEIKNDFDDEYQGFEIPTFTLELSDDLKLGSLSYSVDDVGSWEEIIIPETDESTLDYEWMIPEELWTEWLENQEHIIFFRLTDSAGNAFITTEENTLHIIKNENLSDLFVDVSDFSSWHWDESYKINANIPEYIDVESVSLYYCYSKDNKTWNDFEEFEEAKTEKPYKWDFSPEKGSGYYKFYIKAIDSDSKAYISNKELVSLTIMPTTLVLVLILLGIVLLLVSITVIFKMKKKEKK